ncbi:unnamed protein product [Phytophthora fragariaefolia]|uniref:RING-type E3 ubiquitin transferase n=1 Tax=Phytophthora fragariaefolia TaxID=1490495 RepID=A0A9W6X4U9_9STRA|nr:unnamed protein product [Phytophthora fragariaefolia]
MRLKASTSSMDARRCSEPRNTSIICTQAAPTTPTRAAPSSDCVRMRVASGSYASSRVTPARRRWRLRSPISVSRRTNLHKCPNVCAQTEFGPLPTISASPRTSFHKGPKDPIRSYGPNSVRPNSGSSFTRMSSSPTPSLDELIVGSEEDEDALYAGESDLSDGDDIINQIFDSRSADVVNLAPPRAVAASAASEDDDDVQILSAAEAAAEVAAAARRVMVDPDAASRKRKRPLVETKAEPTECTICCEDCTIVGRHRLVALRCGHLFGKKCIERWVGERSSCPNCSAVVRRADVFPLFSDHVAVVDNSGLEDMTTKYEEEKKKRNRLESDVAMLKGMLETEMNESAGLKQALLKYKSELIGMEVRLQHAQGVSAATSANMAGQVNTARADSAVNTPPTSQAAVQVTQSQTPSPNRTHWAGSQETRPMNISIVPTLQIPPQPSQDPFTAAICKYKLAFELPLLSARVFGIHRSCKYICVGAKIRDDVHGMMLLDVENPRNNMQVPAHASDIRDLSIHSSGSSVLTVAFDGNLAVTSFRHKKVAIQIPLPSGRRQGWSCSFSTIDPYAMFCGFQDGTVAKYDMRKPAAGDQGIVKNFSLPERQPVHSIKLFRTLEAYQTEGLAAATFRGLSVWKNVEEVSRIANGQVGNGLIAATPFSHVSSDQQCFSLASNQLHSGQVVVSSRSILTKHSVFDLQTIGRGQLTPQVEFAGHKPPSVLSRSAMWSEADGTSVVASWSQDTERVTLWNVANHREALSPVPTSISVPRASTGMPVMDNQHAVANGHWSSGLALFGMMTSRHLCLYRSSG